VSYLVFARKYRPETFADVLGQDHVVKTLANAIAQERLAHAYLFVGPRGTGKTTTARIFAKALNCTDGPSIDFDPNEEICQEIAEGRSLDVLEIDGASNNGVDQVRELRETVKFAPAKCRYKIIYIDEVHMLSSAAFNALLKTLEEPPPHVKFIFATTEAHKILPTIISRCQRFDLRPIPTEIIASHLQTVGDKEDVKIEEDAAWAIAKGADGGMRDALSMLDQLVAFCGNEISANHVREIFGFTSGETVHQILSATLQKDNATALQTIQEQHSLGKDLSQLLGELIQTVRALLISKVQPGATAPGLPDNLWQDLKTQCEPISSERLLAVLDLMADSEAKIRWSSDKALHLEIALIRTIQTLGEVSLNDLIKTLDRLPADTPLAQTSAPASIETEQVSIQAVKAVAERAPTTQSVASTNSEPNTEVAPIDESAPSVEAMPDPAPTSEAPANQVSPEPAQEPLPVNPLEASQNQERPQRPKRTTSDISQSLDRLMADAPDELPPEEQPKPVAKASINDEAPKENKPSSAEQQKQAQEDFYQDPLIQEALKEFEGTIVTS